VESRIFYSAFYTSYGQNLLQTARCGCGAGCGVVVVAVVVGVGVGVAQWLYVGEIYCAGLHNGTVGGCMLPALHNT
jgi:hypothetical protein